MRLSDKQALFTKLLTKLLLYGEENPVAGWGIYRMRLRDVYRPNNANYGHPRSTHKAGLAADIIVDRLDGTTWTYVMTNCPFYEMLAKEWMRLGEVYGAPTAWGGKFRDYNHFSFKHEGVS